ncbi:MAG: YjgP/YjgQ family permease [Verrucomicrobia bacterium]|nr:YjgP/YjgQ family permease [Verrucomicrobiota bacterium]
MRLLDRYLLKELLTPFAFCLSGFFIFWISFELFQDLSELQRDGLSVGEILRYYGWKSPELLNTVLPVSLLLAMLYALSNHARQNEFTAMRAAGISLWRISLPYLLAGLVCSLWLFAVLELWAPRSVQEAERIRRARSVASGTGVSQTVLRKFGFESGHGRVWQMDSLDLDTGEANAVHVGWKLADGRRREVVARRAEWRAGRWEFVDAVDTRLGASAQDFPERILTNRLVVAELSESPDQIRAALKINSLFANLRQAAKRPQLSIQEILNYRKLFPQDRSREKPLMTQLHGRLAAPWTCLVVVLIAIPFGTASGRRNAFVGVAASIFICFAYFILMRLGLALGTGGRLTPWIAGWGPNIAFALAGLLMTVRAR